MAVPVEPGQPLPSVCPLMAGEVHAWNSHGGKVETMHRPKGMGAHPPSCSSYSHLLKAQPSSADTQASSQPRGTIGSLTASRLQETPSILAGGVIDFLTMRLPFLPTGPRPQTQGLTEHLISQDRISGDTALDKGPAF